MHTYVGLIKTEIACLSLDATSLDVVKMLVQMNRIMRLQQRSIEFQVIMNHRCPFSYKINFVTIANNYEKINTCMYNWISKECLKEKPKQQQQQQKTAKLQTIKTPPPPPRQQNKQFMHSFSTHTIYILEGKNRDKERHF